MPSSRGKGATALGIVAVALIVALILTLQGQTSRRAITARYSQPDLSVQWHIGPTLRQLRANFAVLRRPASAQEHHAAVAMFTSATSRKVLAPEEVRLAGHIDGTGVYLVVYPVFRHGAWGRVVAHQMTVAGGNGGAVSGFSYIPGNYLIFPQTAGGPDGPTAFFSVVPDGVRTVRWRFACLSGLTVRASGCQLPTPHVVDVPVHDNLAVLQTDEQLTGEGQPYAGVTRVTWYGADGLSKVFTNANAAVPFPGAPARVG